MRCASFARCLTLACALSVSFQNGASQQDVPRSPRLLVGSIVGVLGDFARSCGKAMLVEVAEPLDNDVRGTLSSCDSGFLTSVLNSHSKYAFALHGKAIHFYERSLMEDRHNFLNWILPEFVLPKNVAEFKNVFAAQLNNLSKNAQPGRGIVIQGILPNDLIGRQLPQKRYVNRSARDILLDVQDIDGGFYNVIVFPKATDLNDSDIQQAFAAWQWRSLTPQQTSGQ